MSIDFSVTTAIKIVRLLNFVAFEVKISIELTLLEKLVTLFQLIDRNLLLLNVEVNQRALKWVRNIFYVFASEDQARALYAVHCDKSA